MVKSTTYRINDNYMILWKKLSPQLIDWAESNQHSVKNLLDIDFPHIAKVLL